MLSNRVTIVIVGFCLLSAAFYNGYPLVYSDTGTYIASGMEGIMPSDRPIFYGWWIRLTSLGLSLWLTVIAQALVVGYVLSRTIRLSSAWISGRLIVLVAVIFASISALPWYVGQIMPDVFAPVLLISVIIWVQSEDLAWDAMIILILSSLMHSSFLPWLFLMILVFWLPHYFGVSILKRKKAHGLLGAFLVSVSIHWSTNTILGSGQLANGSHVFLMGRMVDNGILSDHLNQRCNKEDYPLCELLEDMPEDSRSFIWSGPLQTKEDWTNSRSKYRRVLGDILIQPKFLMRFCWHSLMSSFSQLLQNSVGSGLDSSWYADSSSPPFQQIARHFPHELITYNQSRQCTNLWKQGLSLDRLTFIQYAAIIISLMIWLLQVPNLPQHLKRTIYLIAISVVLHAFVTASLANVYDRLQSRVGWMWILIGIIVVCERFVKPRLEGVQD